MFLLTTPGRQLLDRLEINAERMQHRAAFSAGKTLSGTPDLADLDGRLAAKGLAQGDPVFIRIYKLESKLELWMQKGDDYVLFATYPVCFWSGRLGPKLQEGDLQAPEGYYTVAQAQLNPNSRWYRSFNLGFPNRFDQAKGRTGSYLMVHGGCSSIGCYAMTNDVVGEIWTLITAALDAGQARFAVMALPFQMSEKNLERRKGYPWARFWADLKKGSNLFDKTHIPPRASVCEGRYVFAPGRIGEAVPEVEESCPGSLAANWDRTE
ncbi:murein L,D-transpeptidase family protein [Methyloligella sp. 2.7D]|uniref:L,D-transpeptidase family protein n=1 Tax=unclassified Methyloligella TaxID=2625955 RepID=UPI00157C0C1C|nr:murein L,D-transpeptidase family protein [Methyloligella sp. GL2]QKP76591.1 murein L,D-transpeptidase [Methyloligella sp. GL2]